LSNTLRIVFCGTPEIGVASLRLLLSDPTLTVEAGVSQPDRPRGRGGAVFASPVKEAALAAGVRVYQPEKIKSDEAYDFFKELAPDAVVIIAYGQIVPARLIAIPRFGWINLHASLLPKYRGAAPIAWAIANGERVTGLTTMQIDAGMDTGPTLLRHEITIGADETAPDLALRMAAEGAPLVVESLKKLERGEIAAQPQDNSLATYAPILKKEHGRIDWSLPARALYDRMRGFAPWPGTFTEFRGQLCHIWGRPAESASLDAAQLPGTIKAVGGAVYVVCGDATCLALEAVQLEGRKRIAAKEFVNGARLAPGESFGSAAPAAQS
jgi:methionyl-tRNA formyltransferase